MTSGTRRASVLRVLAMGVAIAFFPASEIAIAQGLTGALIGTVTDAQGGVLSGAVVRISSPALIGGELTTKTDDRGELRFPSVPPGSYGSRSSWRDFARIATPASTLEQGPPSRERLS